MLGLHDWQSKNCSRQHQQIAMNNRASGDSYNLLAAMQLNKQYSQGQAS